MQFTIAKEVFLKGLARIQGIVEKRNTIPILSNVLIEAMDGEIHLTATDLEVGMRASYPAKVKTPGKITVAAKKVYEIIKELSEQEVAFTGKENGWIEIRCGKSLFNIVGLSPDEFPHFPAPEEEDFLSLDGDLLAEMIDKTTFSMSLDESKYNLNGIFFRMSEENDTPHLRLVATDGHRLAMIQRQTSPVKIGELVRGVIFPRKGIVELKKLAEDGEGGIRIGFMDNNAVIKKNQTVVIMRLVDGEFPDYNRVIPTNPEHAARIKRETFFHALRRMSILSSEKSRGVKIVLKEGTLELSSSNPEFGDAREEVEIEYNGPEITIGFNVRYLLDILQSMDEEMVELGVRDNLSPGLITPVGDTRHLAVVMPMRL